MTEELAADCESAEDAAHKADIHKDVMRAVRRRHLSQVEVSKILNQDRDYVTRLLQGKLRRFAVAELESCLAAVHQQPSDSDLTVYFDKHPVEAEAIARRQGLDKCLT